jgi:hypothetical protein
MSERTALNPLGLIKQTNATTVGTPNVFVPFYSTSLATNMNLMTDTPADGNKFKTLQTLQAVRSHGGSVTVMAEPNTAARWFDMLSTKGTTTGAGPYTHPFAASLTTDPNYYTLDLLVGGQSIRYWGVQASKIVVGWQGEKMQLQVDLSALGSFYGREIASIVTTTVTLKTDYDPNVTQGLVANDLVTVIKADGSSRLDTTIASITNGTTVVLGASAAAFAAGDMLVLRMPTPALSLLTPFIWGKTQFFFAQDSATALTNSATSTNQTRLESGTTFELMHEFNSNNGEARSGGFDPASLIRKQYDATFKAKQFLDIPIGIRNWNSIAKQAMLMRAYSGATNQYELRLGLNDVRIKSKATPLTSGNVIYQEDDFIPNYDQTDAAGFSATILNNVSTI